MHKKNLFINIHSHHAPGPNEWAIQNLYKDFNLATVKGHYSTGLHPWYIKEEDWREEFESLKSYSSQDAVLAIGECGLDKVCQTNFGLQQEVFMTQMMWANELNKPLIIHCVRAFEEVLQLLKTKHNKVPVIFHGFNKNKDLAMKILNMGHWLSFGKALAEPAMSAVFKQIPADRFFLETDDAKTGIESIYHYATGIKKITTEQLSLQLEKNLQNVFKCSIEK